MSNIIMKGKGRREFLSKVLTLGAGMALTDPLKASPVPAELPGLQGRDILFVYGGWEGHEPEKFRDYLVPWLKEEGANVELHQGPEIYEQEATMSGVDLVVQVYTMETITEKQQDGLLRSIKSGTGIAGWHGGMCDTYRNNPDYQFMTGGQWVAHPGDVIPYRVNITDHNDPLVNGLEDFDMMSEQYYMHVDPNVKVLATTTFSAEHADWIGGCTMPVVWKKMYGKGRVFYSSLGHNLSHITEVPQAIEILKRGIRWASASRHEAAESWISPVYNK